MPLFGSASLFDKLVEKATDENNVAEDWQQILECCDYINSQQSKTIDCLRSILKRMLHSHPNISIQAVILLDACVSNCGKKFHIEVASREFENEVRKLLAKGHPKVVEKFKFALRKWSKNEFKSDPQLNLIVALVDALRNEGVEFPSLEPPKINLPKDPNVVISDQEEQDVIKALELSMKDMKTSSSSFSSNSQTTPKQNQASIFPNTQAPTTSNTLDQPQSAFPTFPTLNNTSQARSPFEVVALYDFEAVEDNELTFKAGDIILVSDSRDDNWWSGSSQRGQGMFPANFVSRDMSKKVDQVTGGKNVQFDDDIQVKYFKEEVTKIDEEKIDRLLNLILEADPTGATPDSEEQLALEEQCAKMSKLIDSELERLDRIQVALNTANRQLTEAMKMYLFMNA